MTHAPRLASRAKTSEKQEQQAICDLIRAIGGHVYVIGTKRPKGDYQGTRQTPGIPDLFCFLPLRGIMARSLWIEVKRKGGRKSDAQQYFASLCMNRNIDHIIGGHDDVANWLKLNGFLK